MICTRILIVAAGLCAVLGAPGAQAQDAASLKARHAALSARLASNQFHRPLFLTSSERSGTVEGDIHARIEQPYALVGPALRGPDHWCDILFLHLNVKQCRPSKTQAGEILSVHIGRKFDQPLADAYPFSFAYRVVADSPGYLQVVLTAAQGPIGTSNYRLVLEVAALDAARSFLHLSYSYDSSVAAQAASSLYLATVGRRKMGFSIVGTNADGQPIYIGSTRGVIERNSMRFYLAIEAYLGALSLPEPERFEKRLSDWFAGVERYPVQLHEMERDEDPDLKRRTRPSR